MNYFPLIKKTSLLFLMLLVLSCASKKDILYYQNSAAVQHQEKASTYEITIQPDDLLMIIVSADDPEIAIPFNLTTSFAVSAARPDQVGQQSNQLYLVDAHGTVEFPVLGKLKVGGLSRTQVLELLQAKIGGYIKNPIINLRIMNFKVSVQGEVTQPGTYPITSERITLIEALTMAKDLTIYGKRNNILIIREIDGVKTYNRVDITQADFIHSPFYYLAQNDVVYVEPNKTKINGAVIGPNTGVIISVTSLLITLITLIISSSN